MTAAAILARCRARIFRLRAAGGEGDMWRQRYERRRLAAEQVTIILLSEGLPGPERDAVRLFFGRGREIGEVARTLRQPPGEAYRLVESGRARMLDIPPGRIAATLPMWYMDAEESEEGARGGVGHDGEG